MLCRLSRSEEFTHVSCQKKKKVKVIVAFVFFTGEMSNKYFSADKQTVTNLTCWVIKYRKNKDFSAEFVCPY